MLALKERTDIDRSRS